MSRSAPRGTSRTLRVGVELDAAGRHSAAWRLPGARPAELFTAAHWRRLAALVDGADLDLLLVPDSFRLGSADERDQRGRLDAVAIAAHLAPLTRRTGLVPVVTTTHTEPFHTNKAVATLDFTSRGRAGWQVEVSTTTEEAEAFGRRGTAPAPELWQEAAETVEVVRALWDSWEDDAVVRDVATGRFVDRDKLHHVDFAGENFSVKGPSITPRSPQGQPLVVVPVRDEPSLAVAAAHADVARVEALDPATAAATAARLRDLAGREVTVLLDVEVLLRATAGEAREAAAHLEELSPGHRPRTLRHLGEPASLVAALGQLPAGIDGAVLAPLDLPATLELLVADVVPRLSRPAVAGTTLRERFGLPRPASRYAVPAGGTR
ncbi:alkanesulfonate monooxygenase SsuD/methylene tetrahydromethanopterin reductase-like flavin-dependent oxidoreductase (luciferase family) [Kineococcus radiotolerans]|uniref:Alkanesulfonate monooxygenase SsuD/methylene tetrahydromethanopterin reductase-like flavin-dependent oxidoreductase (Luciferase family) n=1 Tax=Kineococcus radiotolerans TaxID=131568 RepID=A0A7W4TN03_KINRA|nr:LLM class flavin-dependent oxidoreductase [Kineococcus radiotolerans]MBB2901795.1 alkanesulfonate monooxygenase SsuD/methylene tetrahydromethanopterin reductase-like flavin-dependent oxidoreductase (luciferase family) [Kineococcus radiotolerans]